MCCVLVEGAILMRNNQGIPKSGRISNDDKDILKKLATSNLLDGRVGDVSKKCGNGLVDVVDRRVEPQSSTKRVKR